MEDTHRPLPQGAATQWGEGAPQKMVLCPLHLPSDEINATQRGRVIYPRSRSTHSEGLGPEPGALNLTHAFSAPRALRCPARPACLRRSRGVACAPA